MCSRECVLSLHWDTNKFRIGLTTEQANNRLQKDGPNKIDGAGTVSIVEILLRQVSNSLTIVNTTLLYTIHQKHANKL